MPNVVMFPNGNTFVGGPNGAQLEKFQKSWFILYLNYLQSEGINPEQCTFLMPNGKTAFVTKLKEGGFNWKLK